MNRKKRLGYDMSWRAQINDSAKKLLFLFFVLPMTIMLGPFLPAGAHEKYFVDSTHPNSDDRNDGSEVLPWSTIQHGSNMAMAGDTVYVKNGMYKEWVSFQNSGRSDAPIWFVAYPGHKPIIDGVGINVPRWKALLYSEKNDHLIIDGFEVRNSDEFLIRLRQGTGLTIKNCLVHGNSHNRRNAIMVDHVQNSYIEHNEVYDSGWNAISGESVNDTVFRYNYVHDNPSHNGINIFPNTEEIQQIYYGNDIMYNVIEGCGSGIYVRFQADNAVVGNLICKNAGQGIFLDHHRNMVVSFVYTAETKIYNNTVVANGMHGLLSRNATHLDVKNNIFAYNEIGQVSIERDVTEGHSFNYNCYYPPVNRWGDVRSYSIATWQDVSGQGQNSLSSDPKFSNHLDNDYKLAPQSVAIDRGINLGAHGFTVDLLGTARPQIEGYDLGAYEYTGRRRRAIRHR